MLAVLLVCIRATVSIGYSFDHSIFLFFLPYTDAVMIFV